MAKTSTITTDGLSPKILTATVLITALGYLIDVYDMLIFNVTRVKSLQDMGLSGDVLTDAGLFILNMQQAGLLIGGLFFGVLGDRIGRKACLLGSILVYSLATLGCAFVQDENVYAALRFIAGFGLAGEVGVGIALITETITKEKRGLATALFCFIGIAGAVIAAAMSEFLPWRTCYLIGGLAGLLLLATRALLAESGLFAKVKQVAGVSRGNLLLFFRQPSLGFRYLMCILIGAPIMFPIGLMWTLAPEMGKALGVTGDLKASMAIGIGYTAMMFGDLIAGLVSQRLKSRLKTVVIFITFTGLVFAGLFMTQGLSPFWYYAFCAASGLGIGYWVTLITNAAEQFGTNLRATVATSVPNFVRATLIPMNLLLAWLKPELGIAMSALLVGGGVLVIALLALTRLEETFSKDLDYHH
jgi:putative MFS transporter